MPSADTLSNHSNLTLGYHTLSKECKDVPSTVVNIMLDGNELCVGHTLSVGDWALFRMAGYSSRVK